MSSPWTSRRGPHRDPAQSSCRTAGTAPGLWSPGRRPPWPGGARPSGTGLKEIFRGYQWIQERRGAKNLWKRLIKIHRYCGFIPSPALCCDVWGLWVDQYNSFIHSSATLMSDLTWLSILNKLITLTPECHSLHCPLYFMLSSLCGKSLQSQTRRELVYTDSTVNCASWLNSQTVWIQHFKLCSHWC